MTRVLHLQSSPNLETSVTRSLSTKFVETWVKNHPDSSVDILDLVKNPLPHFGPANMGAMRPPEQWPKETQQAVALTDKLCTQLEEAKIIVIGSPMINFTICTQLKAWIDHVTVAGRTFQYSAPGIVKGLLFAKKVFVISARGGDYSQMPINAFDFQEPLLRMQLGFMGLYDLQFVRAEGMRQHVDEADDIIRAAEAKIERLAF